jgi:predicted small lipoprotein YifL
MRGSVRKMLAALLLSVLATFGLAACGKGGPLEGPTTVPYTFDDQGHAIKPKDQTVPGNKYGRSNAIILKFAAPRDFDGVSVNLVCNGCPSRGIKLTTDKSVGNAPALGDNSGDPYSGLSGTMKLVLNAEGRYTNYDTGATLTIIKGK